MARKVSSSPKYDTAYAPGHVSHFPCFIVTTESIYRAYLFFPSVKFFICCCYSLELLTILLKNFCMRYFKGNLLEYLLTIFDSLIIHSVRPRNFAQVIVVK